MSSERTALWNETLRNQKWGLVVTTAAVLVIIFLLRDTREEWFWIWAASSLGYSLFRIGLYQWCRKNTDSNGHLRRPALESVHDASVLGAGILWSALGWWGIPDFSGPQQFTVLIMLSAMAGGATGTLASLNRVGKIFIAIVVLPACTQLLLKSSAEHLTLGLLGMLFTVVMINNQSNNHRLLIRSITLANENLDLVAALSAQADQVLQANAALELRVAERTRELTHMAHHDLMTGLPNRVLALERFHQAVAEAALNGTSVAILYVDLDNFKYVNDSFGHRVGDQLLCTVAERLRKRVRPIDTVSRQGGDEFLVILPDIDKESLARQMASSLLAGLVSPFNVEAQVVGISTSIGITLYPQHGTDFDTLLRNADAAMYSAKAAGKNTLRFFSDDMNSDALDKLKLKAQLSNALEHGEFFLVFQPQISLETGRMTGAEALVRWRHPDEGIVSPARFIPLAEESGLIVSIGNWVIDEACRQGREWFDAGVEPFVISINVSAQQLNAGDLLNAVRERLEWNRFPSAFLELEFTESGLLKNVAQSLQAINQLRALGVKMAIDDFGTGYSSLSYLRQFKVDKLKIDQSFIRGIGASPVDREIVRTIIHLGKTLTLQVIAEGVETESQLRDLADLNCHQVQGYLVSKPLMPVEFALFQATWPGYATELTTAV